MQPSYKRFLENTIRQHYDFEGVPLTLEFRRGATASKTRAHRSDARVRCGVARSSSQSPRFLIGSIPFGYLIGRFFYRTDIRKSGSGNIGAMNALRTLGKGGAIAVLLLDALKGCAPVVYYALVRSFVTQRLDSTRSAAAHRSPQRRAVLGHCFSPWLGWKGGKGVATSFGAIFAL